MLAPAELPSVATGMALHVRTRESADVSVVDALPSIGAVQARGSRRLSGAWLLEGVTTDAPSDATARGSDDAARASRLSDMVLQRARQGRRFA